MRPTRPIPYAAPLRGSIKEEEATETPHPNRSLHLLHSRGRDPARQVDFGLMSGPRCPDHFPSRDSAEATPRHVPQDRSIQVLMLIRIAQTWLFEREPGVDRQRRETNWTAAFSS